MKKGIGIRAVIGFCAGVTIGTMICILISLIEGNGEICGCIPQIQAYFGTEIAAITVQTFWFGFIGIVFAEAALLFELERWPLLWQYAVHFLVTGAFYLPFMILTNLPYKTRTIPIIVFNILLTYGINWSVHYHIKKKQIADINAALERRKQNERN